MTEIEDEFGRTVSKKRSEVQRDYSARQTRIDECAVYTSGPVGFYLPLV